MSTFSVSSRFPNRRRAAQACVACRMRKTRCDAATPRCGWCEMHNIDCVYRDAQQPRMNYDTQVILERIQLMEDRFMGQQTSTESHHEPKRPQQQAQTSHPPNSGDLDVQIALSHTANANHVFSWPVVQSMLEKTGTPEDDLLGDATDAFFEPSETYADPAPPSWRLYEDTELTPSECATRIRLYFAEVNVFFPLLNQDDVSEIHDTVSTEHSGSDPTYPISPGSYCLLLLVLSLASYVKSGRNIVQSPSGEQHKVREGSGLGEQLWQKAKLLLGTISGELSVVAAQCAMLASLYRGAKGRVAESFHWSHAAAAKCEALARRFSRSRPPAQIPESFSRLFWIAFIYEGDFVSEISVTLPSGIAKYEDLIPYPTFNGTRDNVDPTVVHQEELVAFQITTNASIRRFLNRVNAAIYNAKEQQRQQRDHDADHASWLLRVSQDLWAHHAAVYRALPEFLLRSTTDAGVSPAAESPTARIEGLMPRGNNPWNILRLKGRYYAGQYIIHRPFIEYALLNAHRFDTHPQRTAIIANCATCLHGCMGFIRVFGTEPANSITCLFATGMVTFTMVIILMVATLNPLFRDILPTDIEESISLGIRNLQKFSLSVEEFSWHLGILEQLEAARQDGHQSSA